MLRSDGFGEWESMVFFWFSEFSCGPIGFLTCLSYLMEVIVVYPAFCFNGSFVVI